jgi:hypothetical protein
MDTSLQGILASPSWPKKPGRHSPHVFGVKLQGDRPMSPQFAGVVQLTEFMMEVTAPITWLTKATLLLLNASASAFEARDETWVGSNGGSTVTEAVVLLEHE